MTGIATHIDSFLGALFAAVESGLDEHPSDKTRPRRVASAAKTASQDLAANDFGTGRQLPVCSWLEPALQTEMPNDPLKRVRGALSALAPHLSWFDRQDTTGTGSGNFPQGHANTVIIGPDGLVTHTDFWVGVSLLAPKVRYPDHTHPPEELYLVLSDGEFRNAETDWTKPGIGGLFHNPPGIVHAMRSAEAPLIAVWMLVSAVQ